VKKRSKKELSAIALKAWATRRKAARATARTKQTARAARRAKAPAPVITKVEPVGDGRFVVTAAQPVEPSAPPAAKAPRLRLRADKTVDLYITRVMTALERTTLGDGVRCAEQIGKDMGGGWLVVVTDGFRALVKKGESPEKTSRVITQADPPPNGLTITPELETALRTLLRGQDRKHRDVTIEIDAPRHRVILRTTSNILTVDHAAGLLASAHLRVNLRWLLDGFGRGGRIGYDAKKPEQPLVIDTADGLRYVVMPVRSTP